MPIQLNHKNGAEVYHRPLEKRSKFSIFGSNNQMNYGYVAISDEERNNRGFYTEIEHKDPAYYRKGLKLENAKPIGAPVWTLPLPTTSTIDQPQEAQPSVTESITPSVTGINKMGSKTFVWPYGGKQVLLTGDFDDWKGTVEMAAVNSSNIYDNVFKAKVDNLDLSRDIKYKFIVDGVWCFDIKKHHVKDDSGNINNIIYAQKQRGSK